MQTRVDQRAVIKFMAAQDRTLIQCWRELQAVYGPAALGKTQVRHWHKTFRNAPLTAPTADKRRSGRCKSVRTQENIDFIRELLEDDRHKTVRELVAESGLSQGSVHRIIRQDLKFSRICAKFVPRLLTPEQREHRAKLSADNLSLLADGGQHFMEQIVSGDETWLYCFDPETKMRSSQWHPKGSERPVKPLRGRTASKKVMMTLFFDSEGPVLIHFLEPGSTVTSDEYYLVLAKLRENVRRKRPGMWQKKADGYRSFVVHQDNATPHTASIALATFGENNIEMLSHPAYSPDLAPCDFCIFPNLKDELRGHTFRDIEELKQEAHRVLMNWPKDIFRRAIFDMPKCWAKCVASGGEYFEGRNIEIPPLPEFLDHSEEEWSESEQAQDSSDDDQ